MPNESIQFTTQLASTCPKCQNPVEPDHQQQTCNKCGAKFTLYAGCLIDEAIQPGPEEKGSLKTKSSGLFLRKMAVVGPKGIVYGSLDPVTGLVPIDSSVIAFSRIFSVTTWRRLDWFLLIATSILLLPWVAGLVLFAIKEPAVLIFAAPLVLLIGFLYWRGIAVGAHYARVCGAKRNFTFRYDAPFYRRRRFLATILSRAGIVEPGRS